MQHTVASYTSSKHFSSPPTQEENNWEAFNCSSSHKHNHKSRMATRHDHGRSDDDDEDDGKGAGRQIKQK